MKLLPLIVNAIGFVAGLTWIFVALLFRHPAVPFTFWGLLPPLAAGLLTLTNRGRFAIGLVVGWIASFGLIYLALISACLADPFC